MVAGQYLTMGETAVPGMKITKDKTLCLQCKRRPAKFKHQGKIKRDKRHDLCLQCFRSIGDSLDAAKLAAPVAKQLPGSGQFIRRANGNIGNADSAQQAEHSALG